MYLYMGWREEQQSCDGFCEITSLKIRVRAARPKATSMDVMLHSGRLRVVLLPLQDNQWPPDILVCSLEYRVIAKDNWRGEPTRCVPYRAVPEWFSLYFCPLDDASMIDVSAYRRWIVTTATNRRLGFPGMPVDHQATRDTSSKEKRLGTPLHRVEKPNPWT